MKLFQAIVLTYCCVFAIAKGSIPVFKENVITSEPWLQYSRSKLLERELAKYSSAQVKKVIIMQWLKNRKTKELRRSLARILKIKEPQNSEAKKRTRNGRFKRFKNYHN